MSVSVSDKQGGCCGNSQATQRHDQSDVDSRFHQGTVLSAALPVASDEGCCSTRIGVDEVAGPNRSREVSGLGQVLTLVSTSDHGGVSAGCGCGPDRDPTFAQKERESPLGVDAADCTPLDLVGHYDVSDVDAGLADDEPGSPECCPDGRCEKCGNGDSTQPFGESGCCGGGCCGTTENNIKDDREDAAGTGNEGRHVLHVVTEVTR